MADLHRNCQSYAVKRNLNTMNVNIKAYIVISHTAHASLYQDGANNVFTEHRAFMKMNSAR